MSVVVVVAVVVVAVAVAVVAACPLWLLHPGFILGCAGAILSSSTAGAGIPKLQVGGDGSTDSVALDPHPCFFHIFSRSSQELPLQDAVLNLDAQQSIDALLLADGGGLRLLHCLVGPVISGCWKIQWDETGEREMIEPTM